jgi:O-glycosyl hydrolase
MHSRRSISLSEMKPSLTPSTQLRSLFLLVFTCLLFTALGGVALANGTLKIRMDPRASCQTIDGFGASDAWQCQFVGKNWPIEKRERIAELLFSRKADAQGNPKGIGLSIWRFNVGAGTAEQGDSSDIGNPWRRAECFQNPDRSYDWSKQAGQQWFLKAARQRGVEKLLAFTNSPPVHLTRNGKGYASKGPPNLNVKPGSLDDYAAFLVDVIEHFEKEGLHFDYLSPFNEPQWAWDGSGQEGTPALNAELYALIRSLSRELSQHRLSTQLVIGEAGTIGHILKKVDDDGRDDQAQFFFNTASPFCIGDLPNVAHIISGHSYQSVWPLDKQVEVRRQLQDALKAAHPELGYWMSEYCILERNGEVGRGDGRDLGMNTALYVARIIHHDLTLANARSWQWWTAVSQVDYKDGLVYLDDGSEGDSGKMGPETLSRMRDGVVRESKLLWTLGNYSRFVRPGMVRIQCGVAPEQPFVDGLLASAYQGAGGDRVVVLVNLSREETHCDLGSDKTVDVYTTSAVMNLSRSRQNASSVAVPARALSTCVLE